MPPRAALAKNTRGSALVEFSIVLPLLVVFIVGIYDFSGAFNQKQKIEQAAQEGAIVAGAQPMNDIEPGAAPNSLQPVVSVIFNTLAAQNILPLANQGTCQLPVAGAPGANPLQWTYTIHGCSGSFPGDNLIISINRGLTASVSALPSTVTVSTQVVVSYPYHWRFNSVIQFLVPGASYAATTTVSETATVHNQT
ncbi:MAG: TadE family protein [Terriglobales bacterium]